MDVRIAYAVDLDRVPEKVEEMLNEVNIRGAAHMVTLAMEMLELGHHDMASTLIEGARQALAKADRALVESQMILSGYSKAKEEPEKTDLADSTGESDVD